MMHTTAIPPPSLGPRIKEENPTNFFYPHSNPIDNAAAAAAAAAAAGLIDHNSLLASINGNVSAVNGGTLNAAAVLKSTSVAQQQQQLNNNAANTINNQPQNASTSANNSVTGQQHSQVQKAAMALLNGSNGSNVGATTLNLTNTNGGGGGGNNTNSQTGGQIVTTSSGRSTPSTAVGINGAGITDPAPGKLFVGGLSWQTSTDKLKEYFNMFGTVTDVLIMKDPVTQRSRGFGFITFQEHSSVEKVLQVPIHTLDGKKIDPKHATPKNRPRQSNKTKKIFVGGVSQDTSAEEVKAYFNQFGTVEETVMLMDQQTKRHRGFGFVTFENPDVVDRVCEIHFHTIKNKKVECKKAQPKEAVTPAAQLLQKRIMLGTLGMPIPAAPAQLLGARTAAGVAAAINPLAMLQGTAQLQFNSSGAAAVAAQQAALISQNPFQVQNAAAANTTTFGKLLTTYPQAALHSVRYAPYPIPASAAAAANALAAQQHQQQQHAAVAAQQQQQSVAAQQHTAATNNAAVAAAANQAHNAAALASTNPGAPQSVGNQLAAAAAAQQAALVASTNHLNAATNPYQSYTLANVDMSNFQNIDWSSMYGMGMYI